MLNLRSWTIVCLLAAWVIFLRLPSLDEPLDNDSGANAYHARLMLRGEPLYGSHHTGHHMPGVYYTYELSFLLFGDQQFAPKWLLIPWTIIICWILYWLGRRVSSENTGFISAGFYALGTSQVMLKGMTGEMELFANLPITLAVFLSIFLITRNINPRAWLLVGVLSSLAVIYKVIYLAPIAAAGIAILVDFLEKRHMPGERGKMLGRFAWLISGFIIPLVGLLAYFGSLGLLDRFLLIFRLGVKYVEEFSVHVDPLPLPPLIGFPIFWMAFNNVVLLLFGLVGFLRLARNKSRLAVPGTAIRVALLSWLLLSFFEAGINQVGFAHYVLLIIPSLSFFAAQEINNTYTLMQGRTSKYKASLVIGGMIALVLLNSVITNYQIYIHELAYRFGKETYEQSLANRPGYGNVYLSIKPVVEYIQTHTTSDDLVYYWGVNTQFYYLADRQSPIEFIWPYYAAASRSLENVFNPKTKYIILAKAENLPRPAWLLNGMIQNYRYETTILGKEIYRREAKSDSP